VQDDIVEREPSLPVVAVPVQRACLELHAPLCEIVTGCEAPQRELGFIAPATREDPESPEIDPEDRHGPAAKQACPAKQRAVSAQREQRVDLGVRFQSSGAGHDIEQIRLEDGLEVELTCESEHRAQNLDEAVVPAVAYDSEADHPVSASLS
jgi:hypothetical protein